MKEAQINEKYKDKEIIENELLEILKSLLKNDIKKNDNFFNVGMNSKLSFELTDLIFHAFNKRFTLNNIYDNPSVTAIAQLIFDINKNTQEFNMHADSSNDNFNNNSEKIKKIVYLKLTKTGGKTFAGSVLFPYCIKHKLKYITPKRGYHIGPGLVEDGDTFDMSFRHFRDFSSSANKQWLNKLINDYLLVTIIGEPVNRVVSDYNSICCSGRIDDLSFDEYLEKNHRPNLQSKTMGFNGKNMDITTKEFPMIGTTDLFDESMLVFRRVANLDLSDVLYASQSNRYAEKISLKSITKKQRETIEEVDWLDKILYDAGRKRLLETLNNIAGFEKELSTYRLALKDFKHPLWKKRGSFPIGVDTKFLWAKFCAEEGVVKKFYNPQ